MNSLDVVLMLFVPFIFLLAIGLPISVAIGFSSLLSMFLILDPAAAVQVAAQKMFAGIDIFALLAIPFFVLAGDIMNRGGIALRLINVAKLVAGNLPGALIHANVIANMLFGSISGSSVAAAAAVGGTMTPIQEKEGYDIPFCAAANIASAPTGLLIPPSNPIIIYSLVSGGTSVAALFLAGYIPGILMGLVIMAVVYFVAKKNKYPTCPRPALRESLGIVWAAFPSLMLIVIVIGGIVAGIFTATEGAAIAVGYSLILSIVYRTLSLKDFWATLWKSGQTSAIVLLLISTSSIMSFVLSFGGIPRVVSGTLLGISDNPIIIFLIMNLCLVVVGMFMDIGPAILIFTPIFLPIAERLGMSSVHFGIMLIFNMCLGNITPPVGSVLFVGCGVAKVRLDQVIKPLALFFAVIFALLMVITYVPWFSLFIPSLFGIL